jgi:quercetin dioxygenase-like cupin family protein
MNMNQEEFLHHLAENHFPAPIITKKDAGTMGVHSHTFEPMALIIEGEMSIESGGVTSRYQVGDIFHLQPNQLHSESYGPQGVTYLVSRKE